MEALVDTIPEVITSENETSGIKLLLKTVSQITKPTLTIDYMSVRNIKRSLQCDLEGYMAQNNILERDIHAAKEELRKNPFLNLKVLKPLEP